ncbi:MAG: hypothetical protein A3G93_14330 [Nitrospinae bacterium RIFCSPLOWO2_12_FULL_45_22]|nr:MAG: hypothetical protein A3G93_14330 [Nitrospinae bacterium RIFCSPLOWO2_12_FULL_45_22]
MREKKIVIIKWKEVKYFYRRQIMNAFKYHSIIKENGTIELPSIPLPKGSRVEVIIFPEEESFEIMQAAESSLKFWDNPIDDAIWNNA